MGKKLRRLNQGVAKSLLRRGFEEQRRRPLFRPDGHIHARGPRAGRHQDRRRFIAAEGTAQVLIRLQPRPAGHAFKEPGRSFGRHHRDPWNFRQGQRQPLREGSREHRCRGRSAVQGRRRGDRHQPNVGRPARRPTGQNQRRRRQVTDDPFHRLVIIHRPLRIGNTGVEGRRRSGRVQKIKAGQHDQNAARPFQPHGAPGVRMPVKKLLN